MSDSGSEDGAWDVEKYRVEYESEEHWELRKVRNRNHPFRNMKYFHVIFTTTIIRC